MCPFERQFHHAHILCDVCVAGVGLSLLRARWLICVCVDCVRCVFVYFLWRHLAVEISPHHALCVCVDVVFAAEGHTTLTVKQKTIHKQLDVAASVPAHEAAPGHSGEDGSRPKGADQRRRLAVG